MIRLRWLHLRTGRASKMEYSTTDKIIDGVCATMWMVMFFLMMAV